MNIFESLAKYSRSLGLNARAKAAEGPSPELIDNPTRWRSRDRSGSRYETSLNYRRLASNSVQASSFFDRSRSTYRSYDREPATYYEEEQAYNTANEFTLDFKLASTDPGGFRDLLLQECLLHLGRRTKEFFEFQSQAVQLQEVVRTHLSSSF